MPKLAILKVSMTLIIRERMRKRKEWRREWRRVTIIMLLRVVMA
jgi:hypothetical protein